MKNTKTVKVCFTEQSDEWFNTANNAIKDWQKEDGEKIRSEEEAEVNGGYVVVEDARYL